MKQGLQAEKIDRIIFAVLMGAVVAVPLALRLESHFFFTLVPSLRSDAYTGVHYDLYTIFRLKVLFGLTLLAVIAFSCKVLGTGFKPLVSAEHLLVLAMLALLLLSSVLSPYWYNTMFGFDGFHQGFMNAICFSALFFIASNIRLPARLYAWVVGSLSLVAVADFAVLALARHQHNLGGLDWFRQLVAPAGAEVYVETYFSNIRSIFGNTNYSSGFMGAAFVIYLHGLLAGKSKLAKLLHLVGLVLTAAGLCYSHALSGYLTAAAVSAPVVACFLAGAWRRGKRRQVKAAAAVATLAGTALVLLVCLEPALRNSARQVLDIETPINMAQKKVVQQYASNYGFPVPTGNSGLNRLGIWEETIRLIGQQPLIGHGADTLYYYFPNKSLRAYARISNVYNGDIITKPHSYFLGVAFDAGLPALLCLLAMLVILVKRTVRILGRGDRSRPGALGLLAAFSLAMLFQGIPNDLTVCTGTMVWTVMGLWLGLVNEPLLGSGPSG